MNIWIAFLKSINVGGNNVLPMAELRSFAMNLGWQHCATYIQSGNCVFLSQETDADKLANDLSNAVLEAKGFKPPVVVLSLEELGQIVKGNPFRLEPSEWNKVHFHISLSHELEIDGNTAENIRVQSEQMHLEGKVLYLYAPDGVGKSKLFAKLPQLLSEDVTVRNLKTIMKIRKMAEDL